MSFSRKKKWIFIKIITSKTFLETRFQIITICKIVYYFTRISECWSLSCTKYGIKTYFSDLNSVNSISIGHWDAHLTITLESSKYPLRLDKYNMIYKGPSISYVRRILWFLAPPARPCYSPLPYCDVTKFKNKTILILGF